MLDQHKYGLQRLIIDKLIGNILKNNVAELLQQNFGIEININEEHSDRHSCLMNTTELGIVKFLMFLEFSKQLFEKQCTVRGI
jgi:hypothetical protein